MRELLEILFLGSCVVCRTSGEALCFSCRRALVFLVGTVCERCGNPLGARERSHRERDLERESENSHAPGCFECRRSPLHFTRARSVVTYQGGAIRLVAAWKEGGVDRIARLAAALVADVVPRPAAAVLTSVPPHLDRMLWRGVDPAHALARELGRVWDMPAIESLEHVGGSVRQKHLGAAARHANTERTFCAAGGVPATLCLVDDVYTTGATASAAAGALQSAGAEQIEIVTFARVNRRQGAARASIGSR